MPAAPRLVVARVEAAIATEPAAGSERVCLRRPGFDRQLDQIEVRHMITPRAPRTLLLAIVLSLTALLTGVFPVLADAPPGPYFNGFEQNTSGWFDSSNGGSGTITRT